MNKILILAGFLFLTVTSNVEADEKDQADNGWAALPLSIALHTAIGGPYGLVGVAAEYSPFSWLGIEAGAGESIYGPQFGFTSRLRGPLGQTFAIGIDLALSTGSYRNGCLLVIDCESDEYNWDWAWWLTTAPSIAFRFHFGFTLRIYVGAGFLLNRSDGICHNRGEHCNYETAPNDIRILSAGIASGWAFAL